MEGEARVFGPTGGQREHAGTNAFASRKRGTQDIPCRNDPITLGRDDPQADSRDGRVRLSTAGQQAEIQKISSTIPHECRGLYQAGMRGWDRRSLDSSCIWGKYDLAFDPSEPDAFRRDVRGTRSCMS